MGLPGTDVRRLARDGEGGDGNGVGRGAHTMALVRPLTTLFSLKTLPDLVGVDVESPVGVNVGSVTEGA